MHGPFEIELAEQIRGRLGLRHLDELPLAGAPAVLERGQHRDRGELAGDVVGMVQRDPAG